MKNDNLENENDDVCEVFDSHEDAVARVKEQMLIEDEYSDLSEFFKISSDIFNSIEFFSSVEASAIEADASLAFVQRNSTSSLIVISKTSFVYSFISAFSISQI